MTMPIMAPGLKPSLREGVFEERAGGASGMLEVFGVGAMMCVCVILLVVGRLMSVDCLIAGYAV